MAKERILVGKAFNSTLNVYIYPKKKWHPSESKSVSTKPIKRNSDKRAKQNRLYIKLNHKFLVENPYCQIKVNGCTINATQVHHKKGRIGELLTNVKWFCATCDNCHDWAE